MKFFNLFKLHQTDNIKTKNINKKRADTKKISEVKKGNEAKPAPAGCGEGCASCGNTACSGKVFPTGNEEK